MAENWSRSDWFLVVAIAISIVAAISSSYQTMIARRKAKADEEERNPIIDDLQITPVNEWPAGWFILSMHIKNRGDYPLKSERLKIKRPHNVRIVSYLGFVNSFGLEQLPDKPPVEQLGPTAKGDAIIRSDDVSHERFLLFVSPNRSFIKSKKLVMSLNFAFTNRSASNNEIIIITSIPATMANSPN